MPAQLRLGLSNSFHSTRLASWRPRKIGRKSKAMLQAKDWCSGTAKEGLNCGSCCPIAVNKEANGLDRLASRLGLWMCVMAPGARWLQRHPAADPRYAG